MYEQLLTLNDFLFNYKIAIVIILIFETFFFSCTPHLFPSSLWSLRDVHLKIIPLFIVLIKTRKLNMNET